MSVDGEVLGHIVGACRRWELFTRKFSGREALNEVTLSDGNISDDQDLE
jgi:hypothetical protein